MDIKALIAETEKKLDENAKKISQLIALQESAVLEGNKLLGRLELLKEMEAESDGSDNKDKS